MIRYGFDVSLGRRDGGLISAACPEFVVFDADRSFGVLRPDDAPQGHELQRTAAFENGRPHHGYFETASRVQPLRRLEEDSMAADVDRSARTGLRAAGLAVQRSKRQFLLDRKALGRAPFRAIAGPYTGVRHDLIMPRRRPACNRTKDSYCGVSGSTNILRKNATTARAQTEKRNYCRTIATRFRQIQWFCLHAETLPDPVDLRLGISSRAYPARRVSAASVPTRALALLERPMGF